MIFKNIVFDLDDTLYDHQLPFKRSVEKCFPTINIEQIDTIYNVLDIGLMLLFLNIRKNLSVSKNLEFFAVRRQWRNLASIIFLKQKP